jgi:hypothetical protein
MPSAREARQAALRRSAGSSPRWACRRAISARAVLVGTHPSRVISRGEGDGRAPASPSHLDTRMRNNLFSPQSEPNVEGDRAYQRCGAFTITVRDVDLPAFVSHGTVYVQTPLQGFFDATPAQVSADIRRMETRVSEAGRAALAPDSAAHTVLSKRMVVSRVVRSGRRRR